ncbi:cysteine hydrolase family protein [Kingella potus]|uniref:cysteine hydrolase family protein n=1 Tax=Kingella potus TaxID=265175 RepID=UPI001FD4896C|nr:cysteine hydrolase family protein [Kingella potus]UOP00116.1 cysteine hydrolase [Kingella potus]
MQKTALLIIDVQQSLLDMRPYRAQEMMDAISLLLHTARTHGREVVYVRHNDAADPMFAPHSPGWQIAGRIAPQPGERVVDKQFNSAFRGTDLRDYLRQQGITRLMVVGMMTEYCIESTVRVAGDLGFDVVLPEGANSTLDNGTLVGTRNLRAPQFRHHARSLCRHAGRGRSRRFAGRRISGLWKPERYTRKS